MIPKLFQNHELTNRTSLLWLWKIPFSWDLPFNQMRRKSGRLLYVVSRWRGVAFCFLTLKNNPCWARKQAIMSRYATKKRLKLFKKRKKLIDDSLVLLKNFRRLNSAVQKYLFYAASQPMRRRIKQKKDNVFFKWICIFIFIYLNRNRVVSAFCMCLRCLLD